MTEQNKDAGLIPNAENIIERFGGIRPMATKMAVPVTTVQGWKKRNVIPGNRRDDIIRAAQTNNIDLGNLLGKTANENVTGFEAEVKKAVQSETPEVQKRHSDAIAAAQRTAEADIHVKRPVVTAEPVTYNLKAVERRAVQKSTAATLLIVGLVAGFGTLLLWPVHEKVETNAQQIETLEAGLAETQQTQSLFKGLMPETLGAKFSNLEAQTQDLQARLNTITQIVTDPSTPMGERAAQLGAQVSTLAHIPQVASLLDKIKLLQNNINDPAQMTSAVDQLKTLVASTQGNEQSLDQALAQAQTEDGALGQTLEGVSPTDLKAASLLLGLAQFRTSLNRSVPFSSDLALLQNLLGNDDPALQEAITRLAPQAEKGVLSPAGLTNEFKALTGDIVVASLSGQDVPLKDKAMARLNDVLQVKKDGEVISGTNTQATVTKAQQLLDQGDIQGAITELQALQGPAAQQAAPWMDQAKATLLAGQLKDMLTTKVLSKAGAGIGAGGLPSSGGVAPYTANSGAGNAILQQLETLGTGQAIIHDDQSGMSILPR